PGGVARGAYVLSDSAGDPEVILVGSGSEVSLLLAAKETLGDGARVVSMPCDRLFFEQDEAYRESVLPSSVRARVAAEAASPLGWGRVVGLDGEVVGIDRFGTSAPGSEALDDLGITVEAVVKAARRVTG
ncbi:MAG: transketolase C-terminal domain-containing protein, partial [Bacteroidota bacterium]